MPCATAWVVERGDDVVGLEALDLDVHGMRSASSTSLMQRQTWPLNSSGVAMRLALYSAYSSVRNVWRDTSKATATWVGCSSRSTLISIEVKP